MSFPLLQGLFGATGSPRTSPSAPVINTTENDCYGIRMPLDGYYSGIHLGDNIKEKELAEFEARVGEVDIYLKFLNLSSGWEFPMQEAGILARHGKAIFIKLEPWLGAGALANAKVPQQLIDGHFDFVIREFARKAKLAGLPVFVSIGHEMNVLGPKGTFYPWGKDADEYILLARHVIDVIRSENADNISFVWNPNAFRGRDTELPFENYYWGDEYADVIAFDVYCKDDPNNMHCTSMPQYLGDSINRMEAYRASIGLTAEKTYAVGEWGAINPQQFEGMLRYLAGNPDIHFDIYYNVNVNQRYEMSKAMEKTYRDTHLARLNNGDEFNFDLSGPISMNPDVIPFVCSDITLPAPIKTVRQISADQFQSPAELEQEVCSGGPKKEECLAPLPTGWSPLEDRRPFSLDGQQLFYAEREKIDLTIGDVYDQGSHFYRLNSAKIKALADQGILGTEEFGEIMRIICYEDPTSILSPFRQLTPLDQYDVSLQQILLRHPELAMLEQKYPNFSTYLSQAKYFWENLIILLGVYAQKSIENNDQAALLEITQMGEYLNAEIGRQMQAERASFTKEHLSPYQHQRATLSMITAEAYSQLLDAPISEYQKGLDHIEAAITYFNPADPYSVPDYFSTTKAITVAADLHAKLAQQYLLAANHDAANAEYQTAERLYRAISEMNYFAGDGINLQPFSITVGAYSATSNISVYASKSDIDNAIARSKKMHHLNDPESIASTQGVFRFLRGIALMKQASFYLEFPFKPAFERGYDDIIQSLVYARTGLLEIEAGAPPDTDLRYFRSWGEVLTSKYLMALSDSLAFSTSELEEAEAKRVYLDALTRLFDELGPLFSDEERQELWDLTIQPDDSDPDLVEQQYKLLTKITAPQRDENGRLQEFTTPDYLYWSMGLLKQTFSTHNFRAVFGQKMQLFSRRHLDSATEQITLPQQVSYAYGIDDQLLDKTPVLQAEILVQGVNLELRQSRYAYICDRSIDVTTNSKTLYNKDEKSVGAKCKGKDMRDVFTSDVPTVKQLLERLSQADALLPDTSFLKLEIALMRATFNLTLANYSDDDIPAVPNAARRADSYAAIDLLTATPPDLSSGNSNRAYRTIVELTSLRSRFEKLPEPTRTIMTNQLELTLSMAYITLAANIVNSFPKGISYINKIKKTDPLARTAQGKEAKKVYEYISRVSPLAEKRLLATLEQIEQARGTSAEPLMYVLPDTLAEVHHQLAILYAINTDTPNMQVHLVAAKENNLRSNSFYNVAFRAWALNIFAIPEQISTKEGQGLINFQINTLGN